MKELLQQASHFFERKVNLLLVDDDRHILKSLQRNFTSTAFNITALDTFDSARKAAGSVATPWHCWVFDIDLGGGKTGIDIMKSVPNFPFVIVLSGLQSMSVAAEAVQQGALRVFDKDPESFDKLYAQTCKVAALGYVLGGKHTQYLPIYRRLFDSIIVSVDEWADKACLSLRQLHRICDGHPIDNPRFTLELYYGLYFLLWKGAKFDSMEMPSETGSDTAKYFTDCLATILRKA
jgi:ActR/RegA family two-component response regulator